MVTGASAGIGAHLVGVLHGLGATVVATARRADRLDEVTEGLARAHPVPCDLSIDGAAADLVDHVVDRHGRLDVVVANAGITSIAPATRESVATFAEVVDFDLVRVFELCRHAAPAMRSNTPSGGSIVLISSVVARRIQPWAPTAAYTAAKAGLEGLARELAVQWARHSIRVNCISPGLFPTEMTAAVVESDELSATAAARVPLGRIGALEDLDGPIALLASPAGSFVTGQTLVVDGGWSC